VSAHDQAACLAASLIPLLENCIGPLGIYDAALADAAAEEVSRYVERERQ